MCEDEHHLGSVVREPADDVHCDHSQYEPGHLPLQPGLAGTPHPGPDWPTITPELDHHQTVKHQDQDTWS